MYVEIMNRRRNLYTFLLEIFLRGVRPRHLNPSPILDQKFISLYFIPYLKSSKAKTVKNSLFHQKVRFCPFRAVITKNRRSLCSCNNFYILHRADFKKLFSSQTKQYKCILLQKWRQSNVIVFR